MIDATNADSATFARDRFAERNLNIEVSAEADYEQAEQEVQQRTEEQLEELGITRPQSTSSSTSSWGSTMSESKQHYSQESGIYRGDAELGVDEIARRQGGFLAEFTDAQDAELDDENPKTVLYLTHTAVAPDENEAYHRIAKIIEAKACVGGYSGHISIEDIDVTHTR